MQMLQNMNLKILLRMSFHFTQHHIMVMELIMERQLEMHHIPMMLHLVFQLRTNVMQEKEIITCYMKMFMRNQ